MTPALKVKFRKRKGVPFAVERLSGVQYRCRACNRLFLEKDDLEKHLDANIDRHRLGKPSDEAPQLNMNLMMKVIYVEDLLDSLKKEYIKNDQDEYDDPWKSVEIGSEKQDVRNEKLDFRAGRRSENHGK